jgi:hypothetical protein
MRVDHRRAHVAVAKQFLNGPNIVAIREEMSCKCVPEGMARHPLRHPGPSRRGCHGALKYGLVQMVPPDLTTRSVAILPRRREHPLPRPVTRRAKELPSQLLRQFHISATALDVSLVLPPHRRQMDFELAMNRLGQNGDPILHSLSASNEERPVSEINVLDAQP